MTNRTISIIFVVLSWLLLGTAVFLGMPVMSFYGVICVVLAHVVYYKEGKRR